jgi:8-oxo-dGTP pyrophosphatase MutT (NUDIX family)
MNKRSVLISLALGAIILAGTLAWPRWQATQQEVLSLAPLIPHGAMLYLEARDFSGLLNEWNHSEVKREWLRSENYREFAASRLFLRLQEAQTQFARAAGIPSDMSFLSQAAGTHSALALYDIGNLEFLYVSQVPSSQAMQSALWQSRAKFEPRNAGGVAFYVRSDAATDRVIAFALTDEYLLLATREDLLVGALEAIAGGKEPKLADENWFQKSVTTAGRAGDVRMVLNLDRIAASPHFRSYWIQRNTSDIRQFSASISDLYRAGATYHEERVLLRKEDAKSSAGTTLLVRSASQENQQAVAQLLALVPPDAGLYRAFAQLTSAEAVALVSEKLLAPRATAAPRAQAAPAVQLTSGVVGSAEDLETRIDEPSLATPDHMDSQAALREAIEKIGLLAVLQVESTERDAETSFVTVRSAIVLDAAGQWDAENIRNALQSAVAEITTQELGVRWRQIENAGGAAELDGQFRLCLAVHGKRLILATDRSFLRELSEPSKRTAPPPVLFAEGFNHSAERGNFVALTRQLDCAAAEGNSCGGNATRMPEFFSANLVSFSSVLSGLRSESIVTREKDGKLFQTVLYEWSN